MQPEIGPSRGRTRNDPGRNRDRTAGGLARTSPIRNDTREPGPVATISALLPAGQPFAVIGNGALWQGGNPVEVEVRSLADLGDLAVSRGISQFWLHETAIPPLGLPASVRSDRPPVHPFLNAGAWVSSRSGGLSAWSYWWQKGTRGFDVHVPAWSADSPFRGMRTAVDLLLEVAAFDQATGGLRWCGSGAITSDNFIRQRIEPAPTEVPPPLEDHQARELAMIWHRPAEANERGFRYCHALDLNLAYASAASSLELPRGEVTAVDWPTFDPRVPGVFLFDLEAIAGEVDPAIPPPWSAEVGEGAAWVTGPTAERLVQTYGAAPLEGWVWHDHGRFLRRWYAMLRDARLTLLERPGPALDAVKAVCRMGLGRLASERRTLPRGAEYLEDDPTFQPYWHHAVIAETRCRLHRRIASLPVRPIAVDTDCLYFLSSRPTPGRLAERIGLPTGEALGQFKAAGTGSARQAIEAVNGARDSAEAVRALREVV